MAIMSGRSRSLFQGIRPTASIKRAGLETGLTEQVAGTFRGIIAVPDCWQEMLAPDEPAQQNESQKRWESRDAVPH